MSEYYTIYAWREDSDDGNAGQKFRRSLDDRDKDPCYMIRFDEQVGPLSEQARGVRESEGEGETPFTYWRSSGLIIKVLQKSYPVTSYTFSPFGPIL